MSSSIGRSAFHNPQRYAGRLGDDIRRLQFGAMTGHYTLVTVANGVKNTAALPPGALMVLDWGALEIGAARFTPPPYAERFAYYGQPVEMPADPTGWQDAIRVPVLVQQLGLLSQLVPSIIVINALKALFDQFGYRTEAQQGLLAVYAQRQPRQITMASRPGDVFYAPVLEIVDWMERDIGVFGPRRVEAPVPILTTAHTVPAALATNSNGAAADTSSATTPPASTPLSPPPAAAAPAPAFPAPQPVPLKPTPAAAAPVPANDPPFDGGTPVQVPLDTYRPIGAGRRASNF
jgi:hypothetical protein